MRTLAALGLTVTVVACSSLAAGEAASVASDARVWIGRYAEFEESLPTAPIVKVIDVGQGVRGLLLGPGPVPRRGHAHGALSGG